MMTDTLAAAFGYDRPLEDLITPTDLAVNHGMNTETLEPFVCLTLIFDDEEDEDPDRYDVAIPPETAEALAESLIQYAGKARANRLQP